MGNMKSWMLGAAIVAGAAGLAAPSAHAAEFGIYIGGPAAYVPPCPGPGYVWMNGYMANGYWVPGQWQFVGGYGPGWRHEDDDWGRGYGWGRGDGWRGDHGRRGDRGWRGDRGGYREGYRHGGDH